jgi:hypothetical protein
MGVYPGLISNVAVGGRGAEGGAALVFSLVGGLGGEPSILVLVSLVALQKFRFSVHWTAVGSTECRLVGGNFE